VATEDTDEPEITKEYVSKLRKESEGYRLKATETQQKLDAANTELGVVKGQLESETVARANAEKSAIEAKTAADTRIVSVELKAAALKAGLIDPDDLRLVDAAALKLKEDGAVDGIDAVLETLKTSKPHLFTKPADPAVPPNSTSNPTPPPSPVPPAPKNALEMTDAEYAAARNNIARTGLRAV
jgi:hypothetical protein